MQEEKGSKSSLSQFFIFPSHIQWACIVFHFSASFSTQIHITSAIVQHKQGRKNFKLPFVPKDKGM